MDFNTKQVIVARKDLNMGKGKLSSQCCHASLAVFTQDLSVDDFGNWYLPLNRYEAVSWLQNSFVKICVYVNSEEELIEVYNKAKALDLLCSLIKDSGKTEFKVPTYTAVAIGPAEVSKIDLITGSLPLY